MTKPTDIRVVATELYFLPVQTRVPLKFGTETTTSVTCARTNVTVEDRQGRRATGWGETPLSVQWVWPSKLPYEQRHTILKDFTIRLSQAWTQFEGRGHPLEIGWDFQEQVLRTMLSAFNRSRIDRAFIPSPPPSGGERQGEEAHPSLSSISPQSKTGPLSHSATARSKTPGFPSPPVPSGGEASSIPWLAALVCCSLFDIAIHDAFGNLLGRPTYSTYTSDLLNRDLKEFLAPAPGAQVSFRGRYPAEFLAARPVTQLRAWHLVGGLDLLDPSELTGTEPKDGYPVLLPDWIERDGLKCLKIKLRGNDAAWDYNRVIKVGEIALNKNVEWLTADFNCTVTDPSYVTTMLDQLRDEHPRLYGMLLYVEQPFPYELEEHPIDVHSVSARKPLFLDESAHDWRMIQVGRQLGWNGVALKTCKTQTGAILSACWAKAHGMTLMVQDLTNPMLAQIPHALLAAHVGTIMGVETNAMQFYPQASTAEAVIHPGLYQRRHGLINLETLHGPGFGYRVDQIHRDLPPRVA